MKFEKNKILNGFRGPGTTLDNKREGGREGGRSAVATAVSLV